MAEPADVITTKDALDIYEAGKHRRYSLMFAVNGGAFAVAKLLVGGGDEAAVVLGGLTLRALSIGMAAFTAVMVLDIFMFGEKMRAALPLPPKLKVFGWVGKAVLLVIGLLLCAGMVARRLRRRVSENASNRPPLLFHRVSFVMRIRLRTIQFALLAVGAACSGANPQPPPSALERRDAIEKREALSSTPGEALDRKHRSEAVLAAEGVPILRSLPVIETEAESRRRTSDEVTRRAVALTIVASRGTGLSRTALENMIGHFGAREFFTPDERAFLASPAPSPQELSQFSWRYEGACVLLWALGYLESLGRPDAQCDPEAVNRILIDNDDEAIFRHARLRPQRELLDAADLIYRYHWAVVEAGINHRPMPAGLDRDVVAERHYALNWLIGYAGQEWDDISTDT